MDKLKKWATMNITDVIKSPSEEKPQVLQILQKFLPFAAEYLGLKTFPKIDLQRRVQSPDQPTFGELENHSQTIRLAVLDRHPMDILRTLAHELVHYRQLTHQKIKIDSGDTGSPEENEANREAGVMLRLFAKQNPEYFKADSVELTENFDDGKNPGRKGLSRRVGIPKKATLAQLAKIAKNSTGERRRMAQWQLNMRRGRKRKGLDEQSVVEGEVVKGRFGQKFVPTLGRTVQTSPYQRNPDIEIPEYDPAKNRVWRAGVSDPNSREPFESFETRRSDLGTATHIIGITQSGQRVQISTTTSEELAQVLADAYNRGGFTDKNIERVSLSPVKE